MDLEYTKISFSTSGEPCLNNCKNNKCFTHYSLTPNTCIPGNETALVYHTTNNRVRSEFTCLSRCGAFGKHITWCFVSNDKELWDECNAQTETHWIKGYRTLHNGICADKCKMDDYYENYMCENYYGFKHKCDPKKYRYIRATTKYRENCYTKCDDGHSNGSYYECLNKIGARGNCALPATFPSLRTFFNVRLARIINCINDSKVEDGCILFRDHFRNISALAFRSLA